MSYKPTDSHSYPLFSSSNPNHAKQSIHYTPNFCVFTALAAMTKILIPKLWKWEPFFVERGYPTHLLDSAIQKALRDSRRDTLKPPLAKISDDKITLVLTFHPFNSKARDGISRNFQMVLKMRRQPFSLVTLLSPLDAIKNIRDNLVQCP